MNGAYRMRVMSATWRGSTRSVTTSGPNLRISAGRRANGSGGGHTRTCSVKRNEFAGFENDAARISVYMPLVLPGLLQTQAYMEALLAVGPWPPQWRDRAMAARLRRQQILDRGDGTAPRLVAVITEAALLYRWGSQQDRRTQVAHLDAMSRRPGVELRMLRFAGSPIRA